MTDYSQWDISHNDSGIELQHHVCGDGYTLYDRSLAYALNVAEHHECTGPLRAVA